MSGPKRKKVYEMLARRDGERCFIGGEPLTFETGRIDHWNNINSDNRPRNQHIICPSMNSVKNPRGPSRVRPKGEILSSVSVNRAEVDGIVRPQMVKVQSAEFLKNMQSEPNFRHWLFYQIVHLGQLKLDEVVACGAEFTGLSPQTIRRYLDKLTSRIGLYRYQEANEGGKMMISLKPKWETFRRTNAEKARLREQAKNWRDELTPDSITGKIISL
jgi:hypothetical protein